MMRIRPLSLRRGRRAGLTTTEYALLLVLLLLSCVLTWQNLGGQLTTTADHGARTVEVVGDGGTPGWGDGIGGGRYH